MKTYEQGVADAHQSATEQMKPLVEALRVCKDALEEGLHYATLAELARQALATIEQGGK